VSCSVSGAGEVAPATYRAVQSLLLELVLLPELEPAVEGLGVLGVLEPLEVLELLELALSDVGVAELPAVVVDAAAAPVVVLVEPPDPRLSVL
jgi:hypothetical protein